MVVISPYTILGTIAKKLDRFINIGVQCTCFVNRSSFFVQLPKTGVVKSTIDLLRNVALVSRQFHKYTQGLWVHKVVSMSRFSDHAKALKFLTKATQIEKLVLINPDLEIWPTGVDHWNEETEEDHNFPAEELILAAIKHPHLSTVVSSCKISFSVHKDILKMKKLRSFDFYIDIKRGMNSTNSFDNNTFDNIIKVETKSFVKVRCRDELINLSTSSRNKLELHVHDKYYKFSPEDCKKAFEDKQLPSVQVPN